MQKNGRRTLMEIVIIFLLSCILTARYLDKKKMQAASVLYSVLFIITFTFSLFAIDYEIIKESMINIFGEPFYGELRRSVLGILNTDCFGINLTTVFVAACILQTVIVIIGLTKRVVSYFIVEKKPSREFYKAYFRFVLLVRNLYLPKRINLLYCRLLN